MAKKKQFRIAYRDAWAVALIVFNVLVVAPSSWFLRTLWDRSNEFIQTTEQKIEDLSKEIEQVKVNQAEKYVTEDEFQNHKEAVNQQLISMNTSIMAANRED